jgi:hypothetical protein
LVFKVIICVEVAELGQAIVSRIEVSSDKIG